MLTLSRARPAAVLRAARRPASSFGSGSRMLQVVDCHAEGEPARVIVGGLPHVPGADIRARRQYFQQHLDHYRKLLLHEPRGYPCQNADFVLPPSANVDAAFSVIVAEQGNIYPAMSGHNIMCVATALLETGMVPMKEPTTEFALELPAGLVGVTAECEGGKVRRVTLRNAPAFCRPEDMDVEIDVPHFGKVRADIAYGGMHYVIVDASSVGLALDPARGREICRLGEMIKIAAREQHPVNHPEFEYPGPDILVFREPAKRGEGVVRAKNAVVMSNGTLDWERPETWTGMLDRSPCGTGTCAVMAQLHARGELSVGEEFVHESIIGTTFHGRLLAETVLPPCARRTHGEEDAEPPVQAVLPTISGRAWITQHATVVCDPTDPFPEGYVVGDIW